MDQVKFALKIKEARKEKGWTQKELAERLKITDKAVSKWERALSMPDIEMLGPISKELNIPLAELLDVEDVIKEGQEETTETLLRKLLPLMKEKVHQEVKKKKKLLCSVIAVFLIFSLIAFLYPQLEYYFRSKEMKESEEIIPYEKLQAIAVCSTSKDLLRNCGLLNQKLPNKNRYLDFISLAILRGR